jgi:SAM-dependent methyltransferase
MTSNFKDLFYKHAGDYAKFRPTYPPELIEYLATLTPHHKTAWDCGTGNGQAALLLANYFEHVIATDPSEKQINSATTHPRIEYRIAAAEDSSIDPQSIDLTTVAQAFHWFDHHKFAQEVKRVSRPGAILAVWSYGLAKITPSVDAVVLELYENILGPYWDNERKLVEEGYKGVSVPFARLQTPPFHMSAEWTLDHLTGYLGTWSALQKYVVQNDENPIDRIADKLNAAWGKANSQTVLWDLAVHVWRV